MTPSPARPSSLDELRARITERLLRAAAVLGLVAYLPSAWIAVRERLWGILVIDTLGYGAVILLSLLPGVPARVRGVGLVGVAYLIALGILVSLGPASGGQVWLLTVPVFAAMLLGARVARWLIGLEVLTIACLALVVELAHPAAWEPHFPHSPGRETTVAVVLGFNVVFLSAALALSISTLLEGLQAEQAERRLLETRLRQAQKLEDLGTLAGGIAHDFNNLLQPIVGNAMLVRDELDAGSPHGRRLDEVILSAERGRDLVRRILAVSRKMEVERGPLDLSELIRDTAPLLRSSLPPEVELVLELHARRRIIRADATELHQLLMNLVTNAGHAMAGRRGAVTLRLSEDASRDRLLLEVTDTGVGMARETLQRAFEPFFTTKPAGEGTGLGLGIVQGIVTGLDGTMDVRSTPGQGTTVAMSLPLDRARARLDQPVAPAPRGAHVLLVDDELSVLRVVDAALGRRGYRVTPMADPVKALELFRNDPSVDLLVTDHAMPGMSGLELSHAVRAIRSVPIIVTTGYLDAELHQSLTESGLHQILQKPYRVPDLYRAVAMALEESATGA